MAFELLDRGETVSLKARGKSMWPFIKDGDQVSIGPLVGPPTPGQVVLVPNDDFGQLHRVIAGPVDGKVHIRGDALYRPDGWISITRVAGRLISQKRNGRRIPVRSGPNTVFAATVLGRLRRLASRIRMGRFRVG